MRTIGTMVRGSCGGLQGGGEVDGPGEERLAEDDAGDARSSRSRRMAVEVADAAGDEEIERRRPNGPATSRGRSGVAPPWDRTNRRTPAVGELAHEALERGRRRPRQRNCGEPLRPRVEPDGQPVAGDGEALARAASGSSATLIASTTRVAPAANARRMWSARSRPPATWIGTATRDGDLARPPRGCPALPARAPSKSTRWTIRAPSATNRSAIRSGRSVGAPTPARRAGPEDDPRAPALEVDRRDDLHGRSGLRRAVGRARPPLAPFERAAGCPRSLEEPPVEADRQRAVLEQRVVEAAQAERDPEAALLVGPQLEQQDLAQQVGQLVGRRVRVAVDLGPGVRLLEARSARP